MPLIIIVIIAIYIILAVGTWHYLGSVENNKKIIFILIGIVVSFILTYFTFAISKNGIIYPNAEIEASIQNIIVAVFTGLNGIIFLPYVGRLIDKLEEEEISKSQFKNRICLLAVILILILIIEANYLKGTQNGILEIYQKAANNK